MCGLHGGARRTRAGAARTTLRGGVSAIGSRRSTTSENVRAGLLAAGTLAAVLSITDAESATADRCHARLLLRLTPDVPNPRDPSFLSALTANPLYEIVWVEGNDTTATVDLIGPAIDYHCEDEIKRIRRDAHIMELKVLPPDSENDGTTGL
jgi:hypothetical protein